MNRESRNLREEDLHAYVDGQLDAARQAEFEDWLAANPAERMRVENLQKQNAMLHALFDPVLNEPVPIAMQQKTPSRWKPFRTVSQLRFAAAAGWMVLGGAIGWAMHGKDATKSVAPLALAQQAAIAHVVYTPEVLHPVEVGAAQEAHLVKWLSKRLGADIKAPQLGTIGYELVGGRLLPSNSGPAAQFMYQDARGQRLTLYIRTDAREQHETAFRYAQEGKVGVFYWLDGSLGYALSGEMERQQLLLIAETVYHGLNP
ncbi:MAG: anti-sigma factor [Sulfuricella denitrificans]|nr:anti-sigma factor [Sulfuricella denitrificans]